jgi:uncharacterized protein (TIGR03118 family)
MHDLTRKIIVPPRKSRRHRRGGSAIRRTRPCLESLEARVVLSSNNTPYLQTNLVSDIQGLAQVTDSNLVNPWGVSFGPKSPFWVSNQGSNTSTLYAVTPTGVSIVPLVVQIPTTASGPQGPTGQVFNNTSSFLVNGNPAAFIFANLNGTISAWNGGASATVESPSTGAVYTGLAIASNTAGDFLYAADGAKDRIDVFDRTFKPHDFGPNAFVDPVLPSGLVPFGIRLINGDLFVTYAPAGHDNQTGAHEGQGAVAVFTTSGKFLPSPSGGELITGGKLAAPWGITLAPAGFGTFSGDLLVGNFAYKDSVINAFDPSTGKFRGTLSDASGHPIANPGLWTLTFGNGVNGGDPNTLYFTAGIKDEKHGLFGSLQAIPPLSPHAPIVPNLPNGAFQSLITVPANGDVNPYGVAFVPQGFPTDGLLHSGDILVSNFNNSANQQGTGSTIVDISPNGGESLFFQDTTASGLTTALGVLKSGFVIVGNLPTTYDSHGNVTSIGQGSLRILDRNGNVVTTLSDSTFLDGPWDLTINDQGSHAQVFVSNVLNGVVTRINLDIPKGGDPIVVSFTKVASGYLTRTDPAALVVGPTGLAFDAKSDTLYVASTGDNAIFAIPHADDRSTHAGMGQLVYADNAHLRGPLGLVLVPNGDLITTNGDAVNGDATQPSELVEFTPSGHFVGQFPIDPNPGGAFGLAVSDVGGLLRLAAVDDNVPNLDVWNFQTRSEPHEAIAPSMVVVSLPPAAGATSTSTGASTSAGASTTTTTSTSIGIASDPSTPTTVPAEGSSNGMTSSSSTGSGVDSSLPIRRGHHVFLARLAHRHRAAAHQNHKTGLASRPSKPHPIQAPSRPTSPSWPMSY